MLRLSTFILLLLVAVTSCRSTRSNRTPARTDKKSPDRALAYNDAHSVPHNAGSKRVYKDVQRSSRKNIERMAAVNPYINISGDIENSDLLQFKYSLLTDVPVEALKDVSMWRYLDAWYGTPYRYGGSSHAGVDCSAFTMGLMSEVFATPIPRTVKEQYKNSERIDKENLQEGDLVFFNTRGPLSHVGVYLLNNKFAHASTSSGVMISDLDEDYFARRYQGAGRIGNR